ncbi:MAG: hydrogenase maturation nickel metallochaperone HypA [Candidatus Omnitrophota bacterium]
MHETHLIEPIIKGISQHAEKENALKVTKVKLRVGQLIGTTEDSFKETFALLAKGTKCEGAEVEITFFPGSTVKVISFDVD